MNAKQYRDAIRECADTATKSHPKNAELRSMLFIAMLAPHVGRDDRTLGELLFNLTTDDDAWRAN